MPHSVFTGRPTPPPGGPLFTEEDTAGALALAEEERDTCPSCGYLKVWCRDPANRFGTFDVEEEFCWASYRVADHGRSKKYGESQQASVQLTARFREGREPDLDAGLGLGGQPGDHPEDSRQEGEERPHLGE